MLASGLGLAGKAAVAHRKIEAGKASEAERGEFEEISRGVAESEIWAADVKILETSDRLELDPLQDTRSASAGLKRRALLGAGIISDPDVLLLDEPTNHLDMNSKNILAQALASYRGTYLIVSHDRAFLDPIVDKVYELGPCLLYTSPSPRDRG